MDNIYAAQDVESRLSDDRRAPFPAQGARAAARLAEQHAKFANARKLVLHDVDVSLQAILDLKTRLNTLTAVGQLSDELIARILIAFVDELYYSQSALRDYALRHRHKPPRWLKLTHVCRRWRNIALQTTQLWSHLYLSRSDAFALFVERAKASPLDIDVHSDPYFGVGKGVPILDLIPPVSSRIRFLVVDEDIPTVQAFCKLLTQPLDQLEKLVLASRLPWFGLSGPPPAVPFVASGGLTPRLSHLELEKIPFRWTDPAFRASLTTLKVISPMWKPSFRNPKRPDIGTIDNLLDVLERMAQSLETLYLDGSIPASDDNQNSVSLPPARSLSFPSLRTLHLTDQTYGCADLLSHISINQAASVHFIGSGSRGMEDLIGYLVTHLALRPLVAVRMGTPFRSFSIDMYGWQTMPAIDMSGDWGCAPVRLAFSEIYGDGVEESMQTFVRETRPLLFHVESLMVDNGLPYKLTWSDFFSLTPRLRTLVFVCNPMVTSGLFNALLDVRTLPSGQSLVPLPGLRTVHFNEVAFRYKTPDDNSEPEFEDNSESESEDGEEREFIHGLFAWVVLRVEHGVPLETLGLRNCQHAKAKDVERLRRIVPNVVWDGTGMSMGPTPAR